MGQKLTLKEEAFCEQTAITKNPTEAVRRVYNLGSKGGSKTKEQEQETSSSIATEKMRKPAIREKIEQLLKGLRIDKASRLKKLASIFYDEDKRSSIEANKEITKMTGEYEQVNRVKIEESDQDEVVE